MYLLIQELGKKGFKRNEDKTVSFVRQTLESFPDKRVLAPLGLVTPKNYIESFVEAVAGLEVEGIILYGKYQTLQ